MPSSLTKHRHWLSQAKCTNSCHHSWAQIDISKNWSHQVPDWHSGYGSPSGKCDGTHTVKFHVTLRGLAAQVSAYPCMPMTWSLGQTALPSRTTNTGTTNTGGWQNSKRPLTIHEIQLLPALCQRQSWWSLPGRSWLKVTTRSKLMTKWSSTASWLSSWVSASPTPWAGSLVSRAS